MRAADVFEPTRPIKIRERRSPSLTMIVVLVLLAIIGYGAYRLVSSHRAKSGHPAAAATVSVRPSVHPTASPIASHTVAAAPPQLVIKVTAAEDCWISITKASDG